MCDTPQPLAHGCVLTAQSTSQKVCSRKSMQIRKSNITMVVCHIVGRCKRTSPDCMYLMSTDCTNTCLTCAQNITSPACVPTSSSLCI